MIEVGAAQLGGVFQFVALDAVARAERLPKSSPQRRILGRFGQKLSACPQSCRYNAIQQPAGRF